MRANTVAVLLMLCLTTTTALEPRWWQLHTEKTLDMSEENKDDETYEPLQEEEALLDCDDFESCVQKHLGKINEFYSTVTPLLDPTHFTLADFSKTAAKQVKSWVEEATKYLSEEEPPESRQYPATGYGSYYGNTGYGNYALYDSPASSTATNGLDTALSALAFLAFGVWLLNMLLPHISGANVDLGGLSRQNGDNFFSPLQQDFMEFSPNSGEEEVTATPAMEKVSDDVFTSHIIWRRGQKLLQGWLGEDVLEKGKALLRGLMLRGQEKVQKLVEGKTLEDVVKIGADTVSNAVPWDLIRVGLGLPEPEILNAFLRSSLIKGGEAVRTFVSRDFLSDGEQILQQVLPRNVMEKGKLFLERGYLMLEDMMGGNEFGRSQRGISQVWDSLVKSSRSWDPLAYLTKLISDPNGFPDSRHAQEVKLADETSRYEESDIA